MIHSHSSDLMLRCVTRLQPHPQFARRVAGVVLALCCHHRCSWKAYVGKNFFEACGLSARQFHIISCMCGWATCSSRPNKTSKLRENADLSEQKFTPLLFFCADVDETSTDAQDNTRTGSWNLSPEEREEVGRMCKQLIDHGRLLFLREHGFQTELQSFVEKQCTLENCSLLAWSE